MLICVAIFETRNFSFTAVGCGVNAKAARNSAEHALMDGWWKHCEQYDISLDTYTSEQIIEDSAFVICQPGDCFRDDGDILTSS